MAEKKKKLFPKLKKKIVNFLADESWEITKKDALGISAWAVLLASAEVVDADTKQSKSASISYSGGTWWQTTTAYWTCNVEVVAKHISGVVNGHVSSNPKVEIKLDGSISHASHSSHSSWWWC